MAVTVRPVCQVRIDVDEGGRPKSSDGYTVRRVEGRRPDSFRVYALEHADGKTKVYCAMRYGGARECTCRGFAARGDCSHLEALRILGMLDPSEIEAIRECI